MTKEEQETFKKVIDMLENIQWVQHTNDYSSWTECAYCGGNRKDKHERKGHLEYCDLYNLLKDEGSI